MEQLQAGGFRLSFELNNGAAVIIGYEGTDSRLSIPSSVTVSGSSYAITGIDKKAFLGCKGLRHVVLPSTITFISDWAFSQCIHLDTFKIEAKGSDFKIPSLGRGVFEGCNRLNYVSFSDGIQSEDSAFLLGSVVTRLPAQYLLSSGEIDRIEWFTNYDNALSQYLSQSDYSDSINNVLCGEEDISYDDIGSVDGELLGENARYIQEIRKKKSFLCLIRLMHDSFLSEDKRNVFTDYLVKHSAGTQSNAAWQVIRDDFPDDKELFSLYLSVINPDADALDHMLNDLGNGHPQAKAMLLNYKKSSPKSDSFFDDLLL